MVVVISRKPVLYDLLEDYNEGVNQVFEVTRRLFNLFAKVV